MELSYGFVPRLWFPGPSYSYRNASIGFFLAAWRAG